MYLKNKFLCLLGCTALFLSGCSTGFLGLAPLGDRKEYVRARNLYNEQQYQQAANELTHYIYKAGNVKRREARAYRLLGMSYEQLDQSDKALEVYLEALEFHPKNVPLLVAAAELYQRAGLVDRSQELFDRALEEDPHNAEALTGQAENYRSFGFYSKARTYYDQFFEQTPQAAPIYRARYASTFLNQRNYEQAFIHITMALTEEPTVADYWVISSKAAFGLGNYAQALHDIDTALLLEPDRADLHFYKMMGLYQRGLYAQSLQRARQLLQKHPQDPLALLLAGLNEWQLGQKKAARLHVNQAARIAPDSFTGRVAAKLAQTWK